MIPIFRISVGMGGEPTFAAHAKDAKLDLPCLPSATQR